MKLIFFGDSLTQGTFGASYVDKVAKAMPGHHFVNQGISGDTSLNLYRRVDNDVIAGKPDGVLVMVGVNDAVSAVELAAHPYYRFIKRVPGGKISPLSFRENMRAILGKLQAAGIKTWVVMSPIEYNPAQVRVLREMNAYAVDVCAEMNIPTLDLMAALTPKSIPERPPHTFWAYATSLRNRVLGVSYDGLHDSGKFTYSFDGVHLTIAGAQRIADLIVPFLRANGVR